MPAQPRTRRRLVAQMRRRLDANIAPTVVVRGPRQIGKTTAQFQLIQDLLEEGVDPGRILRVQFDDLGTLTKLQRTHPAYLGLVRTAHCSEAVQYVGSSRCDGLPVL